MSWTGNEERADQRSGGSARRQEFKRHGGAGLPWSNPRRDCRNACKHWRLRLHRTVRDFLALADVPITAQFPEVVADLLAIIKTLVDAAGSPAERKADNLRRRPRRAVFGYFDANC
jgi:hypothetical protein